MLRTNDSWERLVAKVLKRQHDREIALCHSRDPSSSSFLSESFSFHTNHGSSLLSEDEQVVRPLALEKIDELLPSDDSDLKMDHKDWRMMLPYGESELTLKSAALGFFLDQTTGKNCFMLGASNIIDWMMRLPPGEFDTFYHFRSTGQSCFKLGQFYGSSDWDIMHHSKSRFSEALMIVDATDLCCVGRIKARQLSPETLYAAYLVFGLNEEDDKYYQVLEETMSCVTISDDHAFHGPYHHHPEEIRRKVEFRTNEKRADGWSETKLGHVYVDKSENGVIEAVVFIKTSTEHLNMCRVSVEDSDDLLSDESSNDDHEKNYLTIEGIEFRPLIISKQNEIEGKKRSRWGKMVFPRR